MVLVYDLLSLFWIYGNKSFYKNIFNFVTVYGVVIVSLYRVCYHKTLLKLYGNNITLVIQLYGAVMVLECKYYFLS